MSICPISRRVQPNGYVPGQRSFDARSSPFNKACDKIVRRDGRLSIEGSEELFCACTDSRALSSLGLMEQARDFWSQCGITLRKGRKRIQGKGLDNRTWIVQIGMEQRHGSSLLVHRQRKPWQHLGDMPALLLLSTLRDLVQQFMLVGR